MSFGQPLYSLRLAGALDSIASSNLAQMLGTLSDPFFINNYKCLILQLKGKRRKEESVVGEGPWPSPPVITFFPISEFPYMLIRFLLHSSLEKSWLVAHQSVFRLFMKGKFDARIFTQFQNSLIYTGCTAYLVELFQRPLYAIEQLENLHQILPNSPSAIFAL